ALPPPPPAAPAAPAAFAAAPAALAAAAPAAFAAAAPAATAAEPAPASAPIEHVLLLTIDSMRGDQPWTGYPHARTPNLSALAERSIVYERAYAVANVTAASLASLLSGRYPSELPRTRCAVAHYRLGEGLAPFLKAAGVTTSAAHGSAMFASHAAPSGGFDDWHLIAGAAGLGAQPGAVTGAAVAALVEATLASPTPAPRRFLWAHFVDPRHAYAPHADFPPSGHPVRGAYDGEVAYTDAMVGRVLAALERSPLAGRTAVIVAGDHGEAFGEHGYYRHGRGAYDEEFRVPLLVHLPGVAPARIGTPRSVIDVAPTVAALFRLTPPAHWRGRSLLDDLGPEGPVTRPVFLDSPEWKTRPPLRGVVVGQTKVVLEKGFTRLYDLSVDPAERSPVGDKRAVPAVKLARRLLSSVPFVPASPCPNDGSERPFNPLDTFGLPGEVLPGEVLAGAPPAAEPPPAAAPAGTLLPVAAPPAEAAPPPDGAP
ncbi:MAG TPA: sulfatase, partial [Polyangiaceae bacterium]|nr:sulfatase [Polyangiaceae bacterium]